MPCAPRPGNSPVIVSDVRRQPIPSLVPTVGSDLNPRITELTRIDQLTGVTTPLGSIRITNLGPPLGNATYEVMRDLLGISADDIDRMRKKKII